ncbi:hypothetical protein Syun_014117 [Stephania yunnanensis]|uniref:Small auxin up regulated protein n=1 Tax=Stephania yunnanensis TaxID=152371 RepID=A0AAP0JIW7_9MAGN
MMMRRRAPKGHFALYVGSEETRFVVPTSYLKNPVLQELLDKAAEEYGFDNHDRIVLPCEASNFEKLMKSDTLCNSHSLSKCLLTILFIVWTRKQFQMPNRQPIHLTSSFEWSRARRVKEKGKAFGNHECLTFKRYNRVKHSFLIESLNDSYKQILK